LARAVASSVVELPADSTPDCDAGITAASDPLAADQLYVNQVNDAGTVVASNCISCYPDAGTGAPDVWRFKYKPQMRAQGDWILVAVEDGTTLLPDGGSEAAPFITSCSPLTGIGGQVMRNNGYYTDLWAVKPDGSQWVQLTSAASFPDAGTGLTGILGPHWSPDGTKIVLSRSYQAPDTCRGTPPDDACTDANPNIQGYWLLYIAEFNPGPPPAITSFTNITLANDVFYEPQTFSPNSQALIVQTNTQDLNSYGLDHMLVDLSKFPASWSYTNLTNSPYSWDEHASYSAGGNTVAWISWIPFDGYATIQQYGYLGWGSFRDYLSTEMFIMNMAYALGAPDAGTGPLLQQISHFNTPCTDAGVPYPDCGTPQFADAMGATWSGDGTQLLVKNGSPTDPVPGGNSQWIYTFAGKCGN
jgi:Tol biopolymer transport system component